MIHFLYLQDVNVHTQIRLYNQESMMKSNVSVRNQVINYHFKMIRYYATVIVLDISNHGQFTDLFNFVGRKVQKKLFAVLSKRSPLN
jgi:hypothetical protein